MEMSHRREKRLGWVGRGGVGGVDLDGGGEEVGRMVDEGNSGGNER